MSATVQPLVQLPLPTALDATTIERARLLASQSRRSVVAELEAVTGAEPRQLVQAVATLFGLPVVETAQMHAWTPAFDLLPLSKAMQRHGVLLRAHDGELIGIIADPFDADLQTWLEAQAKTRLTCQVALQADIQAYLSKQEETVRAMDSMVADNRDVRTDSKTAAVLSFASVSENASPAVKLVNSTLYDALKAGAPGQARDGRPFGEL